MKPTMAIDTITCISCGACVLACNTHYELGYESPRSWVTETVQGYYPNLAVEFRSERCNHCDNPPCVSNCPTDASFKDENGFVGVDNDKCIGCGACIESCPYDARKFNEKGQIAKCTFCIDDDPFNKGTVCSNACPTSSIYFGDMDDKSSEIYKVLSQRKRKGLKETFGTKPNIFYLT